MTTHTFEFMMVSVPDDSESEAIVLSPETEEYLLSYFSYEDGGGEIHLKTDKPLARLGYYFTATGEIDFPVKEEWVEKQMRLDQCGYRNYNQHSPAQICDTDYESFISLLQSESHKAQLTGKLLILKIK